MTLIIAGYTAAPVSVEDRLEYYRRLATDKRARGFELAWKPQETLEEVTALAGVLPSEWTLTLNGIPSTFKAWAADHAFGLASPDADGRAAAVQYTRGIADAIARINDLLGREAVSAVEIHAAPGFSSRDIVADAEAFRRSLGDVAEIDFGTTSVLVEHCDAYVPGQTPAKGFLTLDEELDAVRAVAAPHIGSSLNWGRSLIELRDPASIVDHIDRANAAGTLRAFTFSGTAAIATSYDVAWADSHLPLRDPEPGEFGEPASAMTVASVEQAVERLSGLDFIAVKTNWPKTRTDPRERAESVLANFTTVASVVDRAGTAFDSKRGIQV
ncbi:DUF4862 family protein [Nocardia jiangxiensis]|uniref:DUF4862 family protein n=1 Tax=Nocardia jiangxiensis TaxID=282685 RepID=A0ABW6S6Q1_9NOCA